MKNGRAKMNNNVLDIVCNSVNEILDLNEEHNISLKSKLKDNLDLDSISTLSFLMSLEETLVKDRYKNIDLSKRECECLFYMLHGQSAQNISNVLGITRRTVESYIENIKNKMAVSSKRDLIDKAHHLGYALTLPLNMLKKLNGNII